MAGLALFTAVQTARLEERYPPRGQFIGVFGGRLHYVERRPEGVPSGVTVVLLHGASGNALEIDLGLGAPLAARGHRVIAFDRPGHGWSDRPKGEKDASPAMQAGLIAQGMAGLGIDRAVVVGHSLAGAVAANLALDHTDRVSGLMLLSAATHPWEGGVAWQNHVATAPLLGDVMVRTIVMPLGLATLEKVADRVFLPHQPPKDYLHRAAIPLILRPDEFQANAEDVKGLLAFVTRQAPRYGDIRVPTTVMTADRDTIVYPDTHSRPIVKQIEGSKLVILPEAGHMPHHTATDRVVAEMDELIARVRRGAARPSS
ncbi:alpha/beta fold hydrolase [Agaricicola taiwanensis]|uniref:alpha/beta fold hydrolase n=1 Tax=Agaricicola taiwanensis TaxID=591372 RepID=UPI001E319A1F|nr:alpha/beta hydrolase [Agaricicola taiwanensis]